MHTVRAILLLLALAAHVHAALDTCDGAYARFTALFGQCPTSGPDSSNTCGNTVCATAISSIDDSALSLMKTGFTACGNLPDSNGMKSYAVYATYFNYQSLNSLAIQCGHPATTVKVTPPAPPALNTCDGAYARYAELQDACPPTQGFNTAPRTPATCGNDACKAAITSIDDNTMSSMKTGFTAADCGYGGYAMSFNYVYLDSLVTQCGHDASTVKVTPPALNTCDGAYARFTAFSNACPYPYSPTTKCGNTSCAMAISFFNDSPLSTINTGFTACGNLPDNNGMKSSAVYATYFNYQSLNSLAIQCGHSASTVKVTPPAPPALNTCDGAYARYAELQDACPPTQGFNTAPRTPATCGNDACKAAITSIDDNTMSSMKTGFTAADCGYGGYAMSFNYVYLDSLVTQCGHDASTVKVTLPALNTCEGAFTRFMVLTSDCSSTRSSRNSSATCGNTVACATAISSIKDDTLSSMKTGFTACGNLDETKERVVYGTYVDYVYLISLATQCGLSANFVKMTAPAVDTCDGAYARLATVYLACPEPYSPATCGNAECETAISGIDDATLALMQTGFTACGNPPDSDWRKQILFSYLDYASYGFITSIASPCGVLEAVKLTRPPLENSIEKCERAYKEFVTFNTSCPGTPQGTYSPATCFTQACTNAITLINDETLKWMTSGFWACDDLNVGDPRKSYKSYAKDFGYTYLHQRAKACGIPQSVVQLTPCSLCGKGIQVPDASKGTFLAHGCSVDGITQEKSSDRASCKQQGGKDDTYQNYTCGSYEASLKEKFWLYELPNRCQKELDQKLYGSGDKIFKYADSKTSHCQCPGATTAVSPPPPTQPQPQPQTPTQPQTTTSDATHVVRITVSLPMRNADFTSDKQTLFKKSLAAAAGKGVLESDVTIDKIETINGDRRLLAESITVRSTIKVPNQAAADTMAKALTQDKINDALSKSGLPAATLLEVTASGTTSESVSFADKVGFSALSFVAVTVLCYYFIKKVKKGAAVQPHKARWKATDPMIIMGLERDHAQMFDLIKDVLPVILKLDAKYAADQYAADKAAADEADAAATNALGQSCSSTFFDLENQAVKARVAADKSKAAADKAAENAKVLEVREVWGTENEPTKEMALGLKWNEAGSEKPSTGTEIKNELLVAALQKQVEFKKEEWVKFQVADLSSNSYIKVGDHYFKPAEMGMDQTGVNSKFEQPRMLVYGPPTDSTMGIMGYMGVDRTSFYKGLSEGMEAIIREVEDKSEVVEIQKKIEDLQRERDMLFSRVNPRTSSRLEGETPDYSYESDQARIKELDEEIEDLEVEAKELDEEIEDSKLCFKYCLYEQAGSRPERFQNGWKMEHLCVYSMCS